MYHKPYIVLISLLFSNLCRGQHVEYNFGAGSGLYHYVSDKIDRIEPFYSMLNVAVGTMYPIKPYVNDPLGDKSGFSFQFYGVVKKVTKHNYIWGLDVEFQSLQSKKRLLYVFGDSIENASGQCKLRYNYIDLFPFFGRRIILKKIYVDIFGGFELAMNLFQAHEKAKAEIISTHQIVSTNFSSRSSLIHLPWDARFRLQSLLGYKQWCVLLGYAWGLSNMDGQGRPNHSSSRYTSLGILYTLKH